MIRKAAMALAMVAVVLLPSGSIALGLGGIEVNSALNEPLSARIALRSLNTRDAEAMQISLGTTQQFERAGIERPFYLSNLRFKVVDGGDGNGYIDVTTANSVNEPFLNFLVEVDWSRGRVVREYTVLLDPPIYGAAISDTTEKKVKPVRSGAGVAAAAKRSSAAAPPIRPGGISRSTVSEGSTYGPVGTTDTLWSIAQARRPNASISVQRMMLAILAANPDAFAIENVNALRAGSVLEIPGAAELEGTDQRTALAEIRRQHTEWLDYRRQLGRNTPAASATAPSAAKLKQRAPLAEPSAPRASSVAKPAAEVQTEAQPNVGKDEGKLKLVASGTEGAASDGEIAEQIQGLRDELNLAREEADSQRQQTEELESRVGQAENLVQDLQRLVEMKEDVIADLQNKLAESDAALRKAQGVAGERGQAQAPSSQTRQPASVSKPAEKRKPAEEQAKKPAKKSTKPVVPKPKPQPSFLDTLEDMIGVDPIIAGAGLGGVLLVGIGGFALARRRRRAAEEADEEVMSGAGALDIGEERTDTGLGPDDVTEVTEEDPTELSGATEAQPGDDDSTALSDNGDTTDIVASEVSDSPDVAAHTDEDPLAEVNVYLAYERYDHAETLVREAIAQFPDRPEYRLRLLEVFHSAKNTAGFEEAAAELQSAVGDGHPHMAQARRWWEDINPGVVLLAGGAAAAAIAADDDIFDITSPDDGGTVDPELSDDASEDTSVDFDLDFGDRAAETPTGDVASDDTVSGVRSGGDEDSAGVDFDLDFNLADTDSPGAASEDDAGSLDFDLGATDELDLSEAGTVDFDLGATDELDLSEAGTVDFDLDATDELDLGAASTADGAVDFDQGATDELDLGEAGTVDGAIDFDLGATDELDLRDVDTADGAVDFDLGATDELDLNDMGTADGEIDFDLDAADELDLTGAVSDASTVDDGTSEVADDLGERAVDALDQASLDADLEDSEALDFGVLNHAGETVIDADFGDELKLEPDDSAGTASAAEAAAQELDLSLDTGDFGPSELALSDQSDLELTLDTSELIAAADAAEDVAGDDEAVTDGALGLGEESAQGPDGDTGSQSAQSSDLAPSLDADALGEAPAVEDADVSVLDLDLSFGEEEAAAATSGADSGLDLTLDIGIAEEAQSSSTRLDFDLSFDDDTEEDQLGTVKLNLDDLPELDASGAGSSSAIDTEFQDIFASDDGAGTTDEFELDFDLALGEDTTDEASTLVLGRGLEGEGDEVQTKLDLAQAYMDMEDLEGARGILGEVLAQGDEAQQEIARNMLAKLT